MQGKPLAVPYDHLRLDYSRYIPTKMGYTGQVNEGGECTADLTRYATTHSEAIAALVRGLAVERTQTYNRAATLVKQPSAQFSSWLSSPAVGSLEPAPPACVWPSASSQDSSTMADTRFSYSRRSAEYNCAARLLAGLLGLGASSSDWMLVRMLATS